MRFIETRVFTRLLQDLYDDHVLDSELYREFQNALIDREERIDHISGTGGVGKVRWPTLQTGKSGGVRFILYECLKRSSIYLLLVYSKSDQEDLTADQKKALKKLVHSELKPHC